MRVPLHTVKNPNKTNKKNTSIGEKVEKLDPFIHCWCELSNGSITMENSLVVLKATPRLWPRIHIPGYIYLGIYSWYIPKGNKKGQMLYDFPYQALWGGGMERYYLMVTEFHVCY